MQPTHSYVFHKADLRAALPTYAFRVYSHTQLRINKAACSRSVRFLLQATSLVHCTRKRS